MKFVMEPWHLLLLILAGMMDRQQRQAIEYLRTENSVLKEKLGKRRILLNDDQRRRLAVKGIILGRNRLGEVGALFTPDTILRWHRQLVAKKWDHTDKRKQVGRPATDEKVVALVLRLAKENPTWGFDRIQGALSNLGHNVSDQTVGNILKTHGIEPVPDRKRQTTWATFLKAHWEVLAAIDFTTVEVWTKSGLVTFYLLFVMELKTRRICFAGCTTSPNEPWMKQTARELTGCDDGFLNGKRYLLMDRDTKFCSSFRDFLEDEKIHPLLLPPRSPNMNAHLERFMKSIKTECLEKMIFFGEKSLRRATITYIEHYHHERNHQGLKNKLIEPGDEVGHSAGEIKRSERLGGLLNYYYREAA